jgi:hypothetical protein
MSIKWLTIQELERIRFEEDVKSILQGNQVVLKRKKVPVVFSPQVLTLVEIFNIQLDDARESLCPPKQKS